MPDYRDIYNHVVTTDPRYNLAENSPGLRAVIQETNALSLLSGRSLDVGCGIGFVVAYLSLPSFDLNPFGVDISDEAIERAKTRLKDVPGSVQRLSVLKDQKLPFDDGYFSLVTCFDVLEHLDFEDIDATLTEIERVLCPGGVFFGSVSCRKSGVTDIHGDNLHRSVESPDWWFNKIRPDRAEYDGHRVQVTLWKHKPLMPLGRAKASDNQAQIRPTPQDATAGPQNLPSSQPVEPKNTDTSAQYQKIYDDNPWYGDAEQGRCPGVRLIPLYQSWLLGPVMDLGCGRGQTVGQLRELGFVAEGIDQITINPDMRVGDITKPIEDMVKFNSVVCVDCLEHLYESQVLGLFANMKQVQRQAFSIHNGESTGTGEELHVNRKRFDEWSELISEHFEIVEEIEIHPEQRMYLTQSKR